MTLPKTISKTTVSGYIGAVSGLLSIISLMPSELQKQIMETMPQSWQPYTALVFALIAFFARVYQSQNTQDVLKSAPADTLQKTVTVETEITKTLP